MKALSRFLSLAMWMFAACAVPKQVICAERARQSPSKTQSAKPKVDLDMSILSDLEKGGVSLTEVLSKNSEKLGKLDIPFLGFVSVYSKTYILQAKELGFTDQHWTLHWTRDGNFLGADYNQPGFSPWKPAKESTYRAYIEAAYHARGYRIVGISKAPVQINFCTFIKEAADHANPNAPIEQIRIRHILLKVDGEDGESSILERYTMSMYAKGIMQSVSGRGASNSAGVAFDKSGKVLFMDNGL